MEPIIWQEATVTESAARYDSDLGNMHRYIVVTQDAIPALEPPLVTIGRVLIAVAPPESGIVPTVVCPDCDGAGKSKGLALIRPLNGPCYQAQLDCSRCDKTGTIPREMLDWIEAGEKLRQDRLDRRIGQSAEARRRGMSPVDLSKMEHGYLKPVLRRCLNDDD